MTEIASNSFNLITEEQTPAFRYVSEYIFETRMGLVINCLSAENAVEPCLAYNSKGAEVPTLYNSGFLSLSMSDFLGEKGKNSLLNFKGLAKDAVWFPAPNAANYLLPFDVLSACFLHLSRLEEYFIPTDELQDKFGRFSANDSILKKADALRIPLIDLWMQQLRLKLKQHFPSLTLKKEAFEVQLTYDIDQAYAFRGKPLWRKWGGILLKLKNRGFKEALNHATLALKKTDPFDTYHHFLQLPHPSVVFFLVGDYARHDKNLSYNHPLQKALVQTFKEANFEIGLHPSFASTEKLEQLSVELKRIVQLSGKNINASRQHYLKMQLPNTYLQLIDNQILNDYTMGFHDEPGFRAATGRPFKWFKLKANEVSELTVHPFVVMDVSLRQYMCLQPSEAIAIIKEILETTYSCQSLFTPLWHNESLSEYDDWKNWRQVFFQMLESIAQLQECK